MIEEIIGIGVNNSGDLELIAESGEKIIEHCVPLDNPVTYLLKKGYNLHIGVPLGPDSCDDVNYQEFLFDLNSSIRNNLIEAYSKEVKNDKREN